MALFENYERRIDKISAVLKEYGISSVEECKDKTIKTAKAVVTGVLAYEFINGLVSQLETDKINVYAIKNNFFGEKITVCGLVTATDIIEQLKDKPLGEVLLIPKSMLRHDDDVFLDNLTVSDVEKALNIKIEAVENDGFELLDKLLK